MFVSALGLVHVARDVTDLSRRVKVRERGFFCSFPTRVVMKLVLILLPTVFTPLLKRSAFEIVKALWQNNLSDLNRVQPMKKLRSAPTHFLKKAGAFRVMISTTGCRLKLS